MLNQSALIKKGYYRLQFFLFLCIIQLVYNVSRLMVLDLVLLDWGLRDLNIAVLVIIVPRELLPS